MTPKPRRKPAIRYFFYQGDLHKKLHINRGLDIITAWNYRQAKACKYSYTDVKRNGGKAFTTKQVKQMVGRGINLINKSVEQGMIPPPQWTYTLTPERKKIGRMWSEEDIMNLHEYLTTVHVGRPRHDGEVNTGRLPSARELRAIIRQGTILYVKDADGNFVPTWDAEKF